MRQLSVHEDLKIGRTLSLATDGVQFRQLHRLLSRHQLFRPDLQDSTSHLILDESTYRMPTTIGILPQLDRLICLVASVGRTVDFQSRSSCRIELAENWPKSCSRIADVKHVCKCGIEKLIVILGDSGQVFELCAPDKHTSDAIEAWRRRLS